VHTGVITRLHRLFEGWISVLAVLCLLLAGARAASFTNSTTIVIPPAGSPGLASPYPSPINVTGMTGVVSKVTVSLFGVNHPRPDDIELLLVSPTGAKLVLLSDAGGTTASAVNANLTFDDAGAAFVADTGPMVSGTFRPTCVDYQTNIQTAFPAPAPAGPYKVPAPRGYDTLASAFNGINPNGNWSLYVVDDVPTAGQTANIAAGWALNITTAAPLQGTTTTLTASTNPATLGQPVTLTATVRRTSDGAIITLTDVTFHDGATSLGTVTLNGSGQASLVTSTLSEGLHTITADYNGTFQLAPSTASLALSVEAPTVTRSTNIFCNTNAIVLPIAGSPGLGSPYPSHIVVSGLTGTVAGLMVTLSNVSHAFPDDIEVLLVGPTGEEMVLMSDAGGHFSIANTTINFADTNAAALPDSATINAGSYRPTSYNSTPAVFPAPAPPPPYNHAAPAGMATLSNVFNGTTPNGTWSLYVVDDVAGNSGAINGGWCLAFAMTNAIPTVTGVAPQVNPSLTGQPVVFVATVSKQGGGAVTTGTVTFREGTTVLSNSVPLNGSGVASYTNSGLSQGLHIITAQYNGSAAFNISSGSTVQEIDAPTTVNGNTLCNPSTITVADGGTAAVYPSRILVSGVGGTVASVTVTLSNVTHPHPDDLKMLLVSPSGSTLLLWADVGGSVGLSSANVTLSDTAAVPLPDATQVTNGTYRPASYNISAPTFLAPAPAGPYNQASPAGTATFASAFGATIPNGYWSLYVLDDTLGNGGGSIGGWCLTLTTTPTISCPANIATANAPGQCQSAPVPFFATASGLPAPTLTYRIGTTVISSPRAFPLGTSTVSVTASNVAGQAGCAFNVTVQPATNPALSVIRTSTNVVLSWSTNLPCVTLQSTPRLLSPSSLDVWTTYGGPFATNGGFIWATNSAASSNTFYRLFY